MPHEIIRDNQFRRRYLLRSAAKMVPLLIGFVALWLDWGSFGLGMWLGIVSFAVGIAMWAWEDRQLLRSYRCPRCGRPLFQPTIIHRAEGDPITFACEACKVEWDTGLRQ